MELQGQGMRLLEDDKKDPPGETWELVFMSIVLFFMFAFLISDRVGPDHVFITALAFAMVAGIVDSKEALEGFANEGVLTVMVSIAQGFMFLLLLCVTKSAFASLLCVRRCLSWHTG